MHFKPQLYLCLAWATSIIIPNTTTCLPASIFDTTNIINPLIDNPSKFRHATSTHQLIKREDVVHQINIDVPSDGSPQQHIFMNEGGGRGRGGVNQGGGRGPGDGSNVPQNPGSSQIHNPHESPAPVNQNKVDLYLRFAFAGAVCSSVTHAALTPVDVVKTRIQLDPIMYSNGMIATARQIISEEGPRALLTGFGPTFTGYFIQGAFKFGGYEMWKSVFINAVGGIQNAVRYRIPIYLASAGLAEIVANLFLCPMEATRIRLVSQPDFGSGMISGFMRLVREEGYIGLYSGIGPMMLKQIPYTMTKFVVYELIADLMFGLFTGTGKNGTTKTKTELSSGVIVLVNLVAGLIAGALAAVISQPADTLLSKINKEKSESGESVMTRLIVLTKQLGVRGLFVGLGARVVMIGILTACQFAINGDIKRLIGATNGYEIAKS